jgi:hypothetical protein
MVRRRLSPFLVLLLPLTVRAQPVVPFLEYRMNEGSGTTVANSGTVAGAVGTLKGTAAFSSDVQSGNGPSSLSLDGSPTSFVEIPDALDYTTTGARGATRLDQVTVEAWIKPATVSGQRIIFDDYGNPGVVLAVTNGGGQISISTDANPGLGISNFSGTVTAGVWQHIAGVYDGSRLRIFVNGQDTCAVVETSGAIIDRSSRFPGAMVLVGFTEGDDHSFSGLIDDLRVFPFALARSELAGGAFAGTPGTPCPGDPAILRVTKSDAGHAWADGSIIVYDVSVRNLGQPGSNVTVREIVPVRTAFAAAQSAPGWTCTADGDGDQAAECTMVIGDLAADETRVLPFAVSVKPDTTPLWDVFNEAAIGLPAADCTPNVPNRCADPSDTTRCDFATFLGSAACDSTSPSGPPADPNLFYRNRDRVLSQTRGGRRLIDLCYAHSADVVGAAASAGLASVVSFLRPGGAAQSFPSLLSDVATAWTPNARALADGNGAAVQITAAQLQAMTAFIDALKASANTALRVTIVRELALLDPPSFVGVTMTDAIARLERLSCEPEATFASVKCRIDELATLVGRLLEAGSLPTKLGKAVAKGKARVDLGERLQAEAKGKPAGRALGKAIKLLRKIEKRLQSKRGVRASTEDARTVLLDESGSLRADIETLRTAVP